jgi:hypothetical protein
MHSSALVKCSRTTAMSSTPAASGTWRRPPLSSAEVQKLHMVVINQPAFVDTAAKRFRDPLDVLPEGICGRG